VAFLISDGAVLIDFIGPWEVFGSVMIHGRMDFFQLYTVAETSKPVRAGGGMKIIPDHTLDTAPAPKVIVIPAQKDASQAVLEWIRRSAKTADVTMSVCTGAYVLAQTGLLNGRSATTHHASYVDFATKFPNI
jgi:transcriptional regulator GlxA family with amidase domain